MAMGMTSSPPPSDGGKAGGSAGGAGGGVWLSSVNSISPNRYLSTASVERVQLALAPRGAITRYCGARQWTIPSLAVFSNLWRSKLTLKSRPFATFFGPFREFFET
jgi:hypothetical protein